MNTDPIPLIDLDLVEPGCNCPRFDPARWDKLRLRFEDKLFVHARTRSILHIPLNMSAVFSYTAERIKAAGADDRRCIILTDDQSSWHSDHFFAVTKEVPELEHVRISGDFITRVFEGPYRDAYIWVGEMRHDIEERGRTMGWLFFYYVTCPKCAERRGQNYVVAVGEVV